jgi:hypothetical protein
MNSANYLSKILLVQSLIISALVFVALPMLLAQNAETGDAVAQTSIRDMWPEDQTSFPVPTVMAIAFTDHRVLRGSLFFVFVLGGILIETRCPNKKTTGTFHALHLLLSTLWGAYFLLGCLAPFIPL